MATTLGLPRKLDKIVILILWGESGTGKSRKAFDENPDAYVVPKPNGGSIWFDGCANKETFIFDEFYGWCPYDLLLRILDVHPLQLPTKGGFQHCVANKFVFTSNKPWEEWYSPEMAAKTDNFAALRRRISEWGTVIKFAKGPFDVIPDAKRRKLEARMGVNMDTDIGFA